ncbi:glucose PTS transporter subunit EIIB [Cellulomonas cellasea]|uniref:glucose PTS transporter subunit EIIB n=1 Tax=Cellulomonas cellasea TaxID=43670 RepID=UPI0025A37FD4|nr:glucose PTS transporter subunit EIIB [Cellulomonas cellasea]MDM8084987.1 glucose PTS transporter subunit EIIB [Cellulomonas cellasea]
MRGPQSQREQAAAILAALGGVGNIDEIEPCTTRLRSLVKAPGQVDAAALRAAGAYGVMISGRVVQVVVGPGVDTLASDLEELM